MLTVNDLELRRGTRKLFAGATFIVHPGWKVGITGANGTGKSSLFGLIRGTLHPDHGALEVPAQLTVAHVAQETPAVSESALQYVLDGDAELRRVQEQLQEAERNSDGVAVAKLHDRLHAIDGYSAEARAGRLLDGLGFAPQQLSTPVRAFSGGWRMRLNLAQALMCRSDMLLLDEPTNHLDLDAVIWLQSWLQTYPGTLLLISHDRDVLDEVCDHILHLDGETATLFNGNYSDFEQRRAQTLAAQQAAAEKQQREVAHMESFVARFRAKASKAKQAQSRLKALERMQRIAPAHVDSPFTFAFPVADKVPSPLLQLDDVSVAYGEHVVFEGAQLSLLPGDRLGLLGANGAGKSTLIKTLAGELNPSGGERITPKDLRIGYFAQHQLEQLDGDASALLHLQRLSLNQTEQQLRDYLGGFGFAGDRALRTAKTMSGGEKARLVLALLVSQRPNLLLLDEPTNHLDLDMRHALNIALQEFNGAVVLVSHDRHLLRTVCERFVLVDRGAVTAFDGDLDDYGKVLSERRRSLETNTNGPKTDDRRERRRREAEQRLKEQPLRKKMQKIEQQLSRLNAERDELERWLAEPGAYDDANRQKLQQHLQRQGRLTQEIEALEQTWLELGEQLQDL